jgi:hypothetical protein
MILSRKCSENSATSFLFLFPRRNSCQEVKRFSSDAIVEKWNLKLSPPWSFGGASILERVKEGYLLWMIIVPHIPKTSRYTIGTRIENKFLDLLECAYRSYFTEKDRKLEYINRCIVILDTLKFLVHIAWEAKIISHKQCEDMGLKLDEIGKMLGGWKKGLESSQEKKTPRS